MRQHSLWALTAALLLCACGPGGQAPFQVVVLVYSPESGAYEPRTVTLTTPTDIRKLQGSVAKLIGGAKFNVDEVTASTIDEARQQVTRNPGGDVNASYIESQGALVPADFHSLNMATTYYNLERAHDFFTNKIGGTLTESRFGVPNVYYFPEFVENGVAQPDNAMFWALIKGFLILPFEQLQQVPMGINQGIVGHEYGHAVFSYNVDGSNPDPPIVKSWLGDFGATPGANLLSALEEGSADLFGVGVTCSDDLLSCDPSFMSASLPPEDGETRRIDTPQCMDEGMWNNLETETHDEFFNRCRPYGCAYRVGSVFASAMWAAGRDAAVVGALGQTGARRQMFQALWNAQSGAGGEPGLRPWGDLMEAATIQSQFSLKKQAGSNLPTVLDAVIDGATDPTLKAALCGAFMDRFYLARSQFAHCPATAQSMNECKR
ncbi:MAG TPA: hypothetical protein VGK67_06160 [Myxococcales bacterium]|jgi:hypothetical protein